MSNSEWGAIPRSLANDVSNMIEKKMGTSSGYKPVEWVSQINLMGKLPIKSASGAIASFADGADGVPVKSCVVSFVASGGGGTPQNPISVVGVSGLSVMQCPNLCNFNDYNVTAGNNTTVALGDDLTLKKGTYTLSFSISATVTATRNRPCYVINGNYTYADSDYKTSGRYSWTFTLADDTTLSIRWWAHTVSDNITISDFELNGGSVALPYSAYVTPSVVTDTFGQTIMGGTRDLTTDKASVTYKHYDLSQISWSGGIIGGQMWCWYADKSADGLKLPTNSAIFDGLCDRYTPIRYNGVSTGENTIALRSNGYLYVNNGSDTVEPTGEVIIAYATAQEITGLTPHEIDTLYGDNNIYADTGTTSVEYRADIDLALNA